MRRVNAEFKKVSDARDAAVAAARAEGVEQLAVKNRELKSLQKRYDSVRAELDTLRSREQAGKKDTEQVGTHTHTHTNTHRRTYARVCTGAFLFYVAV